MRKFWPNKLLEINGYKYIYFGKSETLSLVPSGATVVYSDGEGAVSATDEYGRCCLGEEFPFNKVRGWRDIKQFSLSEIYDFTKV